MRVVAHFRWLRSLLVLAGLVVVGRAEDGWQQLKVGMTQAEADAVVGQPLLTSKARGFMIEIHDAGAEVVFVHGRVASWTAPEGSRSVAPAFHPWPNHAPRARTPSAVSTPKSKAAPTDDRLRRPSTLPAYRL